jgi:hypothetical protein
LKEEIKQINKWVKWSHRNVEAITKEGEDKVRELQKLKEWPQGSQEQNPKNQQTVK